MRFIRNIWVIRNGAALLALAALVIPAAPAAAVTPSAKAAKAAALARARALAKETHASSYRVVGCKRSTPVRYVCQVENKFSGGARRCTATVVVKFVSGRARTTYSNYLCF